MGYLAPITGINFKALIRPAVRQGHCRRWRAKRHYRRREIVYGIPYRVHYFCDYIQEFLSLLPSLNECGSLVFRV